jgi:hypothetical protein
MQICLLRHGWDITDCVITGMLWTSGGDSFWLAILRTVNRVKVVKLKKKVKQSKKVVVATARCH